MSAGIPFAPDAIDAIKKKIVKLMGEGRRVTFTAACEATDVSRATAYEWREADPEWKTDIERARKMQVETRIDKAEEALDRMVEAGEVPAAVFFTLKTLGKERGYVERQEQTGANGTPLDRPYVQVNFPTHEEVKAKQAALAAAAAEDEPDGDDGSVQPER